MVTLQLQLSPGEKGKAPYAFLFICSDVVKNGQIKKGEKLSHYSILISYFGRKKFLTFKGRILIIKYVCITCNHFMGEKKTLHRVVPVIFLPLILIGVLFFFIEIKN